MRGPSRSSRSRATWTRCGGLRHVRSRDVSIAESTTDNSWYATLLQSAKQPLVTEVDGYRTLVGKGGFGKVYITIDQKTGNYFAVKEVDLTSKTSGDRDFALAALHRKVKIMEALSIASRLPLTASLSRR